MTYIFWIGSAQFAFPVSGMSSIAQASIEAHAFARRRGETAVEWLGYDSPSVMAPGKPSDPGRGRGLSR